MVKNHLKRIATPKTWNVLRKQRKFITRPNPGAHNTTHAVSLNTLMKEYLQLAGTTKEVKRMLKEQEVLVDGKKRHDERYNVGFMDVISLPKTKQYFRVGFTVKGKIAAFEVKPSEAGQKLARIDGKKTVKGSKTQLMLSDGRTILTAKDDMKTGDSVLLALPGQDIKEKLPMQKGASVIVYKGKYAGHSGTIEDLDEQMVTVKTKERTLQTRKGYAYVVGKDKPIITCTP